jgi:hypothetical protein
MPYNDDGRYIYESEILPSGDSLRVAAEQLAHDIEEYLFDGHARGYNRPAFLSWALARYQATKQSSGNLANQFLFWDPEAASLKAPANPKVHNTWTPHTEVELGVRYPREAFEHPGIDTSAGVPGRQELYDGDETPDPRYASRMTVREPKVVAAREVPVIEPADEVAGGEA